MRSAGPAPDLDGMRGERCWTVSLVAMVCLNVAAWGAALWSVWHGIGFLDEGYFVAEVRNPTTSVTLWAHILHPLLDWADPGLVALRLVNVIVLSAISVWFAVRATVWLAAEGVLDSSNRRAMYAVAAFVTLGSHLRFASFALAVSYNTMNQAALLATLALTLDARVAVLRGAARTGVVRPLAVGALLAFIGFVKAPTAMVFGPLVLVVWTCCILASHRDRLRGLASMLAGGAGACIVAFTAFTSVSDWIHVVTQVAPQFSVVDPEYALSRLATRFAGEIPDAVVVVVLHYRWVLVLALAALGVRQILLRSGRRVSGTVTGVCVVALAGLFAARVVHLGQHDAPVRGVVQPYLALLLIAGAVLVTARVATDRTAVAGAGNRLAPMMLASVILLTPLAGLFGTNRHWMTAWTFYATPWFVLIAAAALLAARAHQTLRFAPVALTLIGALATSQTTLGVLRSTVGMHAPRWQQSEPLSGFGPLDGVRVDPATLTYLSALRDAADTRGPAGGESIGLFGLEIEQLALRRRAWGGGWSLFPNGRPQDLAAAMRMLPTRPPADALLLVQELGAPDGAGSVLRALDLPFPDAYELRATITHPWTKGLVRVYVPRR